MVGMALLADESSNALYTWGGETSWSDDGPGVSPVLWRFNAMDDGRGSWENQSISNGEVFKSLKRPVLAASASTPTAGFVFGGVANKRSTSDSSDPVNLEGFLSYNYTNRMWSEHTDAPYSKDKTLWGASAVYASNLGPNGLIFVLGGVSGRDTSDASYLDFRTIHFLDPVTLEWYEQRTEGDKPAERHRHCAVGVVGENQTFDM